MTVINWGPLLKSSMHLSLKLTDQSYIARMLYSVAVTKKCSQTRLSWNNVSCIILASKHYLSIYHFLAVATFEIATPPFIGQILRMPQFRDKVCWYSRFFNVTVWFQSWLLSEATNEQCVRMLSVREAKLVRILSGKLSICEFMAVINA